MFFYFYLQNLKIAFPKAEGTKKKLLVKYNEEYEIYKKQEVGFTLLKIVSFRLDYVTMMYVLTRFYSDLTRFYSDLTRFYSDFTMFSDLTRFSDMTRFLDLTRSQ